MHSDSTLTLCCTVEQGTLDVKVFLFLHECALAWIDLLLWYSLNFVSDDPILVNDWAKDEISCFLLDKFVSIGSDLFEAN